MSFSSSEIAAAAVAVRPKTNFVGLKIDSDGAVDGSVDRPVDPAASSVDAAGGRNMEWFDDGNAGDFPGGKKSKFISSQHVFID
jgi:hypothetical protein